MSDTVISVENLSKTYRLGVIGTGTFFGDLNRWWARKLGKPDPYAKIGQRDYVNHIGETVLALNKIDFSLKQGEALGVIGRNGAGKSTLLKILSQVTAPTTGIAKIKGRIASLLEVGTGFHPELTGRENVYLNGSILGMSRAEVSRKFDAIVDFSGVEKFIDTPVKRYSSGMYVRLAFAVAAHLDPDILVVDEVLAVGDIAFQRKCFDKMEEAGEGGRTVVVVSHNMALINRLCDRALLLNSGTLDYDGPTMEVVERYLALNFTNAGFRKWDTLESSPGNDVVKLRGIRVCTEDGVEKETFDIRNPIIVELKYDVLIDGAVLSPGFHLLDLNGSVVFISGGMHDLEWIDKPRRKGSYSSRCVIPGNLLAEGMFNIRAVIATLFRDKAAIGHVDVKEALSFQVHDTLEGDSARNQYVGAYYGVVRPILNWNTEFNNYINVME